MQIHPGSFKTLEIYKRLGADMGFDISRRTDYVNDLQPLLDVVGHDPTFSLIVFTLDETTYGRELAPLAGVYPALKLGPAWWFDSASGMRRYREITTTSCWVYNTVGFNDDVLSARNRATMWLDVWILSYRFSLWSPSRK